MTSKKRRFWILGGAALLLVALAIGTLVSNSFSPDNPDVIRARMQLTETAKPTVISHTDVFPSTKIIQHPKPQLSVDDKILRDLDCPLAEDGSRYCAHIPRINPAASLGCSSPYSVPALLGGLTPSYPMASCSVGGGEYVYQAGCLLDGGNAYLIERNGQYEMVDSLPKLKAAFAPIESENEALSYAIAATGYSAFYGTEIPFSYSDIEYYVEKLENTHVEVRGDEYVVRLYDRSLCGCSQHDSVAIDVAVSRQGDIREIYRELVYRNVQTSCID